MKQLSKIMLAAVASVALAAPAFAWDFSASGSATAYFNQTSRKQIMKLLRKSQLHPMVFPVLVQV